MAGLEVLHRQMAHLLEDFLEAAPLIQQSPMQGPWRQVKQPRGDIQAWES